MGKYTRQFKLKIPNPFESVQELDTIKEKIQGYWKNSIRPDIGVDILAD
jgi:hypothetical protein